MNKRIGIIDAELIGNKKHRFPNLCSMKLSGYHKRQGDETCLLLSYEGLENFDKVYISKVFTKTPVPSEVLSLPNVEYGGTGFFYDKAPHLPQEIEHSFPDYHLYDEWVKDKLLQGAKDSELKFYLDYSIGYLTRGCFRKCYFCVNRNSKGSAPASPLSEFMTEERPKLCFLDDNFFSYTDWESLLQPVLDSKKPFQFNQGLDERLLTESKVEKMKTWRYDGDMIFAFDNIEDKDIIVKKLLLLRDYHHSVKFYVFCGCDKYGRYDTEFWRQDIANMFERIFILKSFGALPYIMRHEDVYNSPYSSFYSVVAAWCNQVSWFKSSTFRDFARRRGMSVGTGGKYKNDFESYLADGHKKGKSWREMEKIADQFPEISERYFDFVGKPVNSTEWVKILLDE